MRIARDIYLEKLKRGIGNGMIKVITGIRRCGKSYLLFELFREYLASIGVDESHIIEAALDDRANAALRDSDAMLAYVKSRITDSGRYFILLDEVQYMAEFEDVLNSLLHIRNAEIYVTGSNSRFLSTDRNFCGKANSLRRWRNSTGHGGSLPPIRIPTGWRRSSGVWKRYRRLGMKSKSNVSRTVSNFGKNVFRCFGDPPGT